MLDGIQATYDFPPISAEDLAKLEVEPQLIPFIVSTTLKAEQSPNCSPPLNPEEAENLVETLDKVVSSATMNPSMKNRCFRVLRKVSPLHGILPKSYFPIGATLGDTIPYASGGFADIWKGQLDGVQVCVKAFRTQTAANLQKIKRGFYREVIGWKYISHANVLPFLGVSETLFSFCLISPWLPNGNIIEYTLKHQRVNRLNLLAQAACGLEYLHSLSIVHSDVNPGNILITEEGIACLGDFGITGVITDPSLVEPGSTTTSKPGVARYMAPELLNPSQFNLSNANPSKESDIYSLAMTAYETLTGILPYGNARDGIIIFHVVTGDRPPRPTDARWLQDQIWNMIMICWSDKREQRWDIHTVYNELMAASIQEIAEAEQDVQTTTRSLNAVKGTPHEDLPGVPTDVQMEVPNPATTKPKPFTSGTPAPTRSPKFPPLPRTGRGTNESRSGPRVRRKGARKNVMPRRQRNIWTVVGAMGAFFRFKESPRTDVRPSQ